MSGVELGARYRAGLGGVRIVFRDGTVVQLAPRAVYTFSSYPLKIEGRLFLVTDRGVVRYEVSALGQREIK